MARWGILAVASAVLVVACIGDGAVTTSTDTTGTTVLPTTSMPCTSSTAAATTSSTEVPVTPTTTAAAYYRYGDDGLVRVVDGVATLLFSQPVAEAFDDHLGGVIFALRPDLDPETTYWIKADGTLTTLPHDPALMATINGASTVGELTASTDDEFGLDLRLIDLRTGAERSLPDVGFRGDGWSGPNSFGGSWFVGVERAAFGCGGSDADIVFWDKNGVRVEHPYNPVPQPCGPCELSAVISSEGRTLAYSLRADAPSEYHGRLVCGAEDEWWEDTQRFSASVRVLDLLTGKEIFRAAARPQARVADFDGRHLVVERYRWDRPDQPITSLLYDITRLGEPVIVTGRVVLVRSLAGTG